ncbi:MAG TPA: four-carbon acid sugar kinase family protein [Candidatus Avipropionibacterium avicola]|uniref:3-oxo-tetronate kinase n=1 Tax=Candidatus Avipropionibacterium avicola TaxID=2840701 RepID=A0A9D1KML7_9ACTN|nr:four-carbon acid sugar kinase family protein [Candidatus Avipropionibacterium avicola]
MADDFTGATDLAGNWQVRGLRTSVLLGVPEAGDAQDLDDVDAVVIALKSRSIPASEAVDQTVASAQFLLDTGCEQLYEKYASTFDSTAAGNIGPVADALLELTGADRAVVVPAFPDNGRTVYQGHLFVGSQPLDESPMCDHPLNPMRDSSVVRLLGAQTRHTVGHVPLQVVRRGAEAIRLELDRCATNGGRLVVVDAVDNEDLVTIALATAQDRLVTGGSGLALGAPSSGRPAPQVSVIPGERVVLSGSASEATRRQVTLAKEHLAHQRIDLHRLREDSSAEVCRLVAWVREQWVAHPQAPVLVYSVGDQDDLQLGRTLGGPVSAEVEQAMARLALELSEAGATQFMVAGGETSGAALEALGVRRLDVGQQISPGVSWLTGRTAAGRQHNFVLKSGNFGPEDLFVCGWDLLT